MKDGRGGSVKCGLTRIIPSLYPLLTLFYFWGLSLAGVTARSVGGSWPGLGWGVEARDWRLGIGGWGCFAIVTKKYFLDRKEKTIPQVLSKPNWPREGLTRLGE
jgi:hypothetical protein